jgi:hypothetical protein
VIAGLPLPQTEIQPGFGRVVSTLHHEGPTVSHLLRLPSTVRWWPSSRRSPSQTTTWVLRSSSGDSPDTTGAPDRAASGEVFTLAWMLMAFEDSAVNLKLDPRFVARVLDRVARFQQSGLRQVAAISDVAAAWAAVEIALGSGPVISPTGPRAHFSTIELDGDDHRDPRH